MNKKYKEFNFKDNSCVFVFYNFTKLDEIIKPPLCMNFKYDCYSVIGL